MHGELHNQSSSPFSSYALFSIAPLNVLSNFTNFTRHKVGIQFPGSIFQSWDWEIPGLENVPSIEITGF
jgi:hypothetical protein